MRPDRYLIVGLSGARLTRRLQAGSYWEVAMDDDMPADREAWFKAVELAARDSWNLTPKQEACRARELYVLLTTGKASEEV